MRKSNTLAPQRVDVLNSGELGSVNSHPTDTIELVSVVDAGYCPHLAVLLMSIAATNPNTSVLMHVIHSGVSPALQSRVAVCAPSIRIEWHQIIDDQDIKFLLLPHVSRTTYYRLKIDEILGPDIARVLYLDVDMVVNGDLRPLWETDLGDNLCGAVVDPGASASEFALAYHLGQGGAYFNAGMLLMDLSAMRREGVLAQALALLGDPKNIFKWADQDVLNIVLWNKWLLLDPTWNFQREFLYENLAAWRKLAHDPAEQPIILHYTEGQKPWVRSEWHPLAWLYVKYLRQTSFKSEIFAAGGITNLVCFKWWLRAMYRSRQMFNTKHRHSHN